MKIKNIFFVMALALFAFAFNSNVQAADVDLVENGDFELGNANWQGVGCLTDIINSTDFDGSYFAFVGFEGEYDEIYQQGISLPSNATSIKIRFNYSFEYDGGTGVVAVLDENNSLTPLSGIVFDSNDDTGGNIGVVSGDLTSFKGKDITLVIAVDNEDSGNYNSTIAIDNIYITASTPATNNPVNLYRFWSEQNKGHFYTASGQEKSQVVVAYADNIWRYESVAYKVYEKQVTNTVPVYRFWSDVYSGHFYTASESEKNSIIANDPNWSYEGTAYYTYESAQSGTKPVYRFWSNTFKHHFYTASESEKNSIIANDPNWAYEGVAWYVVE